MTEKRNCVFYLVGLFYFLQCAFSNSCSIHIRELSETETKSEGKSGERKRWRYCMIGNKLHMLIESFEELIDQMDRGHRDA